MVWESKEERAFAEEIAKQFTAQYNVPIKIEEVAPPDQVGKLTQDGPSGLAADVVLIPHDNLGKAVSASLLLPNDIFGEQTKAENTEASIVGSSYEVNCTVIRERQKPMRCSTTNPWSKKHLNPSMM